MRTAASVGEAQKASCLAVGTWSNLAYAVFEGSRDQSTSRGVSPIYALNSRSLERKLLKLRTERLINAIGSDAAMAALGKGQTTLRSYYSDDDQFAKRFIPIDAVAVLENRVDFPYLSDLLAEFNARNVRQREKLPENTETEIRNAMVRLGEQICILLHEICLINESSRLSQNQKGKVFNKVIATQITLRELELILTAFAAE